MSVMESLDMKTVSVLVGVGLAWSGLLVGIIKVLIERAIGGSEKRFERIEEDLEDEADKRRELEREFRSLLADLPLKYVQREDWIRLATTIEAKMDTLNMKFDELKDRIYARD
jgi:chromosome segregation ATPase